MEPWSHPTIALERSSWKRKENYSLLIDIPQQSSHKRGKEWGHFVCYTHTHTHTMSRQNKTLDINFQSLWRRHQVLYNNLQLRTHSTSFVTKRKTICLPNNMPAPVHTYAALPIQPPTGTLGKKLVIRTRDDSLLPHFWCLCQNVTITLYYLSTGISKPKSLLQIYFLLPFIL